MASAIRFFTASNGARIAYTQQGSGPTLVVPPAFLSNLALMNEAPWYQALNDLWAEHFTVVRYDRYGCGLSDRHRSEFNYDLDYQILCDLIDHVGTSRVVLFGASDGMYTSVRFAASSPHRMSHLILFGCGLYTAQGPTSVLRAVRELSSVDLRVGSNALADWLLPDGTPEQRVWFSRLARESAHPDVVAGLERCTASIPLTDLLKRITVPTLVVHRRGDRVTSVDQARELTLLIAEAEIQVVPGDAHIAELGDPGPVCKVCFDFVFGKPDGASAPRVPQMFDGAALTPRETEVLHLLASGLSNREMALRLSVSEHTIERHLSAIYAKLGVRGRTAALALVHQAQAT